MDNLITQEQLQEYSVTELVNIKNFLINYSQKAYQPSEYFFKNNPINNFEKVNKIKDIIDTVILSKLGIPTYETNLDGMLEDMSNDFDDEMLKSSKEDNINILGIEVTVKNLNKIKTASWWSKLLNL